MTDTLTPEQLVKKRKLITIVCIIALVINGFSLFDNTVAYISPEAMKTMLIDQVQKDKVQVPNFTADFSSRQRIVDILNNYEGYCTIDIVKTASLFAMIAAAICLIGAFLLLMKNKLGLHFFIIGTLTGILAPFLLFGSTVFSLFLGILASFFWIIILILLGKNINYIE